MREKMAEEPTEQQVALLRKRLQDRKAQQQAPSSPSQSAKAPTPAQSPAPKQEAAITGDITNKDGRQVTNELQQPAQTPVPTPQQPTVSPEQQAITQAEQRRQMLIQRQAEMQRANVLAQKEQALKGLQQQEVQLGQRATEAESQTEAQRLTAQSRLSRVLGRAGQTGGGVATAGLLGLETAQQQQLAGIQQQREAGLQQIQQQRASVESQAQQGLLNIEQGVANDLINIATQEIQANRQLASQREALQEQRYQFDQNLNFNKQQAVQQAALADRNFAFQVQQFYDNLEQRRFENSQAAYQAAQRLEEQGRQFNLNFGRQLERDALEDARYEEQANQVSNANYSQHLKQINGIINNSEKQNQAIIGSPLGSTIDFDPNLAKRNVYAYVTNAYNNGLIDQSEFNRLLVSGGVTAEDIRSFKQQP